MLEELTVEELLAAPIADEGESGEGADAEDVVNPVLPDGVEMLWALGCFLLLWLAMKALIPQINRTRHERDAQIAAAKDAADNVEGNLGTAQADYDQAISNGRAEAARVMEEARAEAEADRDAKIAVVEAELAETKAAAMAEVEQAKQAARASLQSDAEQVAVGAASNVIGKPVDVGSARAVLDRVLGGTS